MDETPQVIYYGPDADEVGRRWADGDRDFALRTTTAVAGVPTLLDEHGIDGVVIAGEDALSVLETVRSEHPRLPLVVFGDPALAAEALDRGATHYLPSDGDRIPLLEGLAETIDRHREDRRERTMLRSLLEHIPVSVYFKDRESRYVRVSDAMLTMTGKSYIENEEGKRFTTPADVVGTSEFDLFLPGPAETAVADDRNVMADEEPLDNKVEHVYGSVLDGTFVVTSKAPWYDENGDVVGLVGVTRDVSERKQYEYRLERQNERLERFAQVVSHDLRNPLEVARGRLALAREEGDDEHFDAIDDTLERMDALIDDVLTLARQGETVDDPERVALAEIARDAWEVVESRGATLDVDTDVAVDADPARLRRLFENLFRNAVEHGPTSPQQAGDAVEHGGREDLTVTVRDLHGDQGFVVADDGQGIPEEEREDVFEAGFTTGDGGAGLGLNIVRTIADAHGWHVSVHESDESGAAFQFEIPN